MWYFIKNKLFKINVKMYKTIMHIKNTPIYLGFMMQYAYEISYVKPEGMLCIIVTKTIFY